MKISIPIAILLSVLSFVCAQAEGESLFPLHVELRGHTANPSSATFAPDGKTVVTSSYDGTVRTWDAESGKELQKIEVGSMGSMPSSHFVNDAVFSPDGKKIATVTNDNIVRIWDAESGKKIRELEGHTRQVFSVAFSPDGKKIVSAGRGPIRIWDVESGKELKQLGDHTSGFRHAAFSPDNKKIATADNDGIARIWDVESGEILARMEGHTATITQRGMPYVNSVVFSPDGKRIVTAGNGDGTARIWDVETGKELMKFEHGLSIVIPAHEIEIPAQGGEPAQIIQVPQQIIPNIHPVQVCFATFSPDGKQIATGRGDALIQIWDAESGEELRKLEILIEPVEKEYLCPITREMEFGMVMFHPPVLSVAYSPDGKRIVAAYMDTIVRVWELEKYTDSQHPINFERPPERPAIRDF